MIYLACPYTHANYDIRAARARNASLVAARLMEAGVMVFSPISHGHALAQEGGLPINFEFWKKHSLEMVKACDAVFVLMIEGWDRSVGVAEEIEHAHLQKKPIYYISTNAPLSAPSTDAQPTDP